MTKVTSVPASFNQNEISAFINKKTGQVVRVLQDVYAESPRVERDCNSHFWTFSSRYDSPDVPEGYNGETNDFDEALGYVLGFDEENYEEKIEQIRTSCRNANEFSKKLHQIAAEKEIWLDLVSLTEHGERNYVLGALSGWDEGVVGFIWTHYSNIKRVHSLPEFWEVDATLELGDYNDYVNGRVYAVEYLDPEETDASYGVYLDFPDDKSVVLTYAQSNLVPLMDEDLDLEDWVPAKRHTKVVYTD